MIELASGEDLASAKVLVSVGRPRGADRARKQAELLRAGWKDDNGTWVSPMHVRYASLHMAWVDMRRQRAAEAENRRGCMIELASGEDLASAKVLVSVGRPRGPANKPSCCGRAGRTITVPGSARCT